MKNSFLSILLLCTLHSIGQNGFYITSSDSTKLYVQSFGSGEPVVILAGGPGLNAVYMKPIWETLSKNYRCIVLDQRGTAKSKLTAVDSSKATVASYVNDLEALRKYLNVDQMTLIGHSWGGMLSMEYAARHPKSVRKLVLLDPGGPTKNFLSYFNDNLFMRLREEDFKEMAQLDSLKKNRIKGYWPGYFYDRDRAIATKNETNFDELLDANPRFGNLAMANYISTTDERVKLLKLFSGPVYIIQGRQDPIGESTVYEIKSLLPQSQVYFIEKCGHIPWAENPEQVKIFYERLNKCLK